MEVKELMSRNISTVTGSASLNEAVFEMKEHDSGCVVVVDERRAPIGMLTDRDVCLTALLMDLPISSISVQRATTSNVYTCGAHESIEEAERIMGQHQIRRLPVVDEEGRLEGLLSIDDIAREAWREEGLMIHRVSAADVGKTLGQISRVHLIAD